MLKNFLVINSVDGDDSPEFTLTAPPREHVALIVKSINDGLGTTDWKVGAVEGTDNIVIDYFGKYCDEALHELAEKTGVEYWAEGTTVNLTRCEHGEPLTLGYDCGLTSLDCGEAGNVKFYTRLFPVGSSRNIDRTKYGSSRLRLPDGKRFVEINAELYSRIDHYEEDAFADIYPRYTGTVSSVRAEEQTGSDGKKFTVYYFKDDALPFDPNDYEIGGLVKRVSFHEGSNLAGLGNEDDGTYYFEANFDSTTREWEIITIWPNDDDMQLPGAKLVPTPGDRYIPWNISMPDEYYRLAENEFLDAVNKYNDEHALDVAVYKAPTDHVWIEQNHVELSVGRRIRLESPEFFPEKGYRDSRITKITRKVNLPSSMDLEIGDALSRSTLEKMSDDINDAKNYVRNELTGIGFPDLIRTGDRTPATDNNVYSALRTDKQFIHKDRDDYTPHALRVGGGVVVPFPDGTAQGSFREGWMGVGARTYYNPKTQTVDAWVDRLFVRDTLETMKLRFNMIDVIAGEQWQTFAYGTVDKVWRTDGGLDNLTIELLDGEMLLFKPGDIVRGIFHNIDYSHSALDNDNTATRPDDCGFTEPAGFYTVYLAVRFLTDIDGNAITGSDGSFLSGKNLADAKGFAYALRAGRGQHHPQHGLRLAAYGNFTDKERQATTFANTRRLVMLEGVDTWIIDPAKHYRYVRGDIEGMEIGGTILHGHGLLISNAYIHGSLIHLSEQQRKELAGADAYAVSLTAETGVLNIGADGMLPPPNVPFWMAGNAVDKDKKDFYGFTVPSGVSVPADLMTADGRKIIVKQAGVAALTAEGSRLWTSLTVMRGGKVLAHSAEDTIPDEGQYTVTLACLGCTAVFRGGLLRVTSLEGEAVTDDKGKVTGYRDDGRARSVTLTVNCEGIVSVTRTYTVTTVADGEGAQSVLQSFVFLRAADQPATPTGGTFTSPVPADGSEWTDGPKAIDPDNPLPLWTTHRIFTSDGRAPQEAAWSTPAILADSADMDVCYHDGETRPLDPPDSWHGAQDGSPACNGWYNEATDSTVWMAVSRYRNGSWGAWNVIRIKGESGISPYILDLSNEYDTILIDPADKCYALDDVYLPSTEVRFFFGGKALPLASLAITRFNAETVSSPSKTVGLVDYFNLPGITTACARDFGTDADGNPYGKVQVTEVTNSKTNDVFPERAVLRIRATADVNGQPIVAIADWTLAKKYGDCIYNLVPEVTQIHIDGDGAITNPELSDGYLKCEIQAIRRQSKGGITMLAAVPDNMRLTVTEAAPQGPMGGGFNYSTGVSVDGVIVDGTTDYAFTLEEKQSGGSWQLVDRENVPVVRDGKKGADGEKGERGLPGYQVRLWKQIYADQEFRNDQLYDEYVRQSGGTERDGSGYIDFLAVRCPAMASGWAVYRYNSRDPHEADDTMGRSAEISKVDTAEPYDTSGLAELLPNDHAYWTPVALNEASGFFDTLIANYALIDVLAGTQFLIRNEGNNVVGGLQGSYADGPIFWAGADQKNFASAPVRIYADGHIEAEGSFLSGDTSGEHTEMASGEVRIFSEGKDASGNSLPELRTVLTGKRVGVSDFTEADTLDVGSGGSATLYAGGDTYSEIATIINGKAGVGGNVRVRVDVSGNTVTLPAATSAQSRTVLISVPYVSVELCVYDTYTGKIVQFRTIASAHNEGWQPVTVTIPSETVVLDFYAEPEHSYQLRYKFRLNPLPVSGSTTIGAYCSFAADTDITQSRFGANGFIVRKSVAENFGVIEEEVVEDYGNSTRRLAHFRNGSVDYP